MLRLAGKSATRLAHMPTLNSTKHAPRRLSPRAWLASALAVMWIAGLLLRVISAGEFVGSVHCCCGAHRGDAPCGCADCPLAEPDDGPAAADPHADIDASNGDHAGYRAAAFKRCGAVGKFAALDGVVVAMFDVGCLLPVLPAPRRHTAYQVGAPEPVWRAIVPPPRIAALVG